MRTSFQGAQHPYGDSAGLAFSAGSTSYNLFTSGGSLYECSSPYCGSPYQQAVASSAALGLCPGNQSAVDLGWTYDRYGNRWSQATTAGSAPQPSFTFTHANNQIDSGEDIGYDAAGNATSIGSTAYYYDAENRLIQVNGTALGECSTATACYGYDTEGRRAYENVGGVVRQFIYDVQGRRITTDATLAATEEEITFGGRHLASYTSSNTFFTHADWLGTERVRTDASGALVDLEATLPFGDMQYGSNTTIPTSADFFTGKERDPETGLDYFGARHYSGVLGRFMSSDPTNMSVEFENPQSWNRYSYAYNNPLNLVDRNGLWPTEIHNEIIDGAFGSLSNAQRAILKVISKEQDDPLTGGQSETNAYQHEMRAPWQSVEDAQKEYSDFVGDQIAEAQLEQAKFLAAGNTGISDDALVFFARALHAIEDSTSPAHAGFQVWDYSCFHCVTAHIRTESTISPSQFQASVSLAQQFFLYTFGSNGNLTALEYFSASLHDAGSHQLPCVTTTDSAAGTTTSTCSGN